MMKCIGCGRRTESYNLFCDLFCATEVYTRLYHRFKSVEKERDNLKLAIAGVKSDLDKLYKNQKYEKDNEPKAFSKEYIRKIVDGE